MRYSLSLWALIVIFMTGCSKPETPDNSHLVMATLWFQKADECRALYYQAFQLAQLRLDLDLATGDNSLPRAVVVDIDETILDNSPYQVYCILNDSFYPSGWRKWTSEAKAPPMPGAAEFLNYAASRGVEVFYITNRKATEGEATLQNLKLFNFPMADSLHLLLRTQGSNKEERRRSVMEKYRIVLLAGDNLNDFTSLYEKVLPDRRRQLTDSLREEFGHRFIVLPNPMYGDWESAMFGYRHDLSEHQKDSIRRVQLEGF